MAESFYRRNPTPNPLPILKARSALLKQAHTVTGQSSQMRNPAWVTITGTCNKCGAKVKSMTLPRFEPSWNTVYKPNLKISPSVTDVTIETIATDNVSAARRVSATIICYKMEDFIQVMESFLLPGNYIKVEFGYHNPSWGPSANGKLDKLRVATFNFNTTDDGQWVCNFTAVSAVEALKHVDVQTKFNNTLSYKIAGSHEEETKHDAYGIATTILSDAQHDGNDSIDKAKDGDVLTNFQDYNPGIDLPNGEKPYLKYYNADYRRTPTGHTDWIHSLFSSTPKNELEVSKNDIYVSLGYVVNRLVNDRLLRAYSKHISPHDQKDFVKLKIRFDEKMSLSHVGKFIVSGDPTTLLILGPGQLVGSRGNYLSANGKGGKNFEKPNPAPIATTGDGVLKTWNMLISRWAVVKAFADAVKTKEATADSTGLQAQKEEVVNLVDFLDNLFRIISECLGGAVNLTMVEDPKNPDHLLIIDQNYGVSDKLTCVVFDPIDHDGSTRTCRIESNVGSSEYRTAMFVGNSKRGDPISKLRECETELIQTRNDVEIETTFNAKALIYGHLAKNNFSGDDIQALKSLMSSLFHNRSDAEKNETIHFPGMQITIEIDGVYGFQVGNAISSTQLPPEWRKKNIYFFVTNVTHRFSDNDWVTSLSGIMTYYNNISYEYL